MILQKYPTMPTDNKSDQQIITEHINMIKEFFYSTIIHVIQD